jgi:hypothetical protein
MKLLHVLILASAIVTAGVLIGVTQPSSPSQINGCVVGSPVTSYATGISVPFSCDLTGKLRVTTTY